MPTTLTNKNICQPALSHLQRAYEICIKSYYIFLETTVRKTAESTAYDRFKLIRGHNTQESTVSILHELAELETNRLQAQLAVVTDPILIDTGRAFLEAINRYRTSIDHMVTRHDLQTNYLNNVRNYTRTVEGLYTYYQKSSTEVL